MTTQKKSLHLSSQSLSHAENHFHTKSKQQEATDDQQNIIIELEVDPLFTCTSQLNEHESTNSQSISQILNNTMSYQQHQLLPISNRVAQVIQPACYSPVIINDFNGNYPTNKIFNYPVSIIQKVGSSVVTSNNSYLTQPIEKDYYFKGQFVVHSTISVFPDKNIQQTTYYVSILTQQQIIQSISSQLSVYKQAFTNQQIQEQLIFKIKEIRNLPIKLIKETKNQVSFYIQFGAASGIVMVKLQFQQFESSLRCEIPVMCNNKFIACGFSNNQLSYFLMADCIVFWRPNIKTPILVNKIESLQEVSVQLQFDKRGTVPSELTKYRFFYNGKVVQFSQSPIFDVKTLPQTDGLYGCEVVIFNNDAEIITKKRAKDFYVRYQGEQLSSEYYSTSEEEVVAATAEEAEVQEAQAVKRPKPRQSLINFGGAAGYVPKGVDPQVEELEILREKEKKQKQKTAKKEKQLVNRQFFLPIYHKVVQYSVDINKTYQLIVRSPYTKAAPTCQIYAQLNVKQFNRNHADFNLSGFLRSASKTQVKSVPVDQDNKNAFKYLISVDFDKADVGKLMWILIQYSTFQFAIPLTCQPILDGGGILRKPDVDVQVGLLDYFNSKVQLGQFTVNQDFLCILDENQKVMFTASPKEAIPIAPSLDILNPGKLSLMTSDAHFYNNVLDCCYGQMFRINEQQRDQSQTSLFKKDMLDFLNRKDNPKEDRIILTDLSNNLVVYTLGSSHLLSFTKQSDRDEVLIKIHNRAGLLFEKTYVDKLIENLLNMEYDLDELWPELLPKDVEKVFDKITLPEQQEYNSETDIIFDLYHPDETFQRYLQLAASIVVHNQRNQVVRLGHFAGSEVAFACQSYDVGSQVTLFFNGFNNLLSRQVRMADQSFGDEMKDQIRNGKFNVPIVIQTYQGDQLLEGTAELKKGQLLLQVKKLHGKYSAKVDQCGVLLWQNPTLMLGMGNGSISMESDYAIDLMLIINGMSKRIDLRDCLK